MSNEWPDIVVQGVPTAIDEVEVRRYLELVVDPSRPFEIRGLVSPGKGYGTICKTVEEGVAAVKEHGRCIAIWIAVNPLLPGAPNARKAAMANRRWLFIDIDPVRPKDEAATNAEKLEACVVAGAIVNHLNNAGWPDPIMIDSGNGWHLYYRIDLPNDEPSHLIVRNVLRHLGGMFSSQQGKIGVECHNADRLAKIPGTMAMKGSNTPERPHRQARIYWTPDRIEMVSRAQLEELAALGSAPPSVPPPSVPPAPPASQPPEPDANGRAVPGAAPWDVLVTDPAATRHLAYFQKALEDEVQRVATAAAGNRNNQLNSSAFVIGTMAGWTEVNAAKIQEARDKLRQAACQCGLDQDPGCGLEGINKTIDSAIASGMAKPRSPLAPSLPTQQTAPGGARRRIEITTEEYRVTQEAAETLPGTPNLYQRSNMLVEIQRASAAGGAVGGVSRPEGSIRIMPVSKPTLREHVSTRADFVRCVENKKKNTWEWVSAHAPGWTIDQLYDRRYWPGVAHLEGVIECPTMRPDGSLLLDTGYDPQTGLWVAHEGNAITVEDHPAKARCQLAYQELTRLVEDFPFAGDNHQAAWVAALLTVVARPAIDGPCPLFMFDANVAGAGKSLLADLIAAITTGRSMARTAYPERDEEMEKVLLSIVMSGDRHVLFDNVATGGKIGGKAIDGALTSRTWKGRVLGKTEWTPDLPMNCIFFATGNNIGPRGDAVRRVVHCRLNSPLERPEERTGFQHPDLLRYAQQNRGTLLVAALTILRGYVAAGKPRQNLMPMGSYDEWAGLIRSAIFWASNHDPCASRSDLIEDDEERNNAIVLLTGIADVCTKLASSHPLGVPSSQLLDVMERYPSDAVDAAKAFVMTWGDEGKKPSSQTIGYRLRSISGKLYVNSDRKSMTLRSKREKHVTHWTVV
jgi:hypothetical protein